MPRQFDHGELNIPGRTSSINAELDRYKAGVKCDEKAKVRAHAAEMRALKAQAKALQAEYGDAIVEKFAGRLGKAAEIRITIDQMAKWEPRKFIDFVEKFHLEK